MIFIQTTVVLSRANMTVMDRDDVHCPCLSPFQDPSYDTHIDYLEAKWC